MLRGRVSTNKITTTGLQSLEAAYGAILGANGSRDSQGTCRTSHANKLALTLLCQLMLTVITKTHHDILHGTHRAKEHNQRSVASLVPISIAEFVASPHQ